LTIGFNIPLLLLIGRSHFLASRGISGAVSALACSSDILASTPLDCYARLYSTTFAPEDSGEQQSEKGRIAKKVYFKAYQR
jgi:hypothetical protein